ncbi:hypothetical protein Tco_0899954, partial [Tanacetum coccineum]
VNGVFSLRDWHGHIILRLRRDFILRPRHIKYVTIKASRDDADDEDEDEDEDEEEEEEEHPASADSVLPVHRITARISIRDEPSISLPPREEVERLLALTTPPPSPLTPLSSPLP